jgi:hypothetical protein
VTDDDDDKDLHADIKRRLEHWIKARPSLVTGRPADIPDVLTQIVATCVVVC